MEWRLLGIITRHCTKVTYGWKMRKLWEAKLNEKWMASRWKIVMKFGSLWLACAKPCGPHGLLIKTCAMKDYNNWRYSTKRKLCIFPFIYLLVFMNSISPLGLFEVNGSQIIIISQVVPLSQVYYTHEHYMVSSKLKSRLSLFYSKFLETLTIILSIVKVKIGFILKWSYDPS